MPTIEFVLEGPPVSLNARDGTPRSRKRYREWMKTVEQTALRAQLIGGLNLPTTDEVSVTITCYHRAVPPDVDNIIKPIFDGMNGVVYEDDRQVYKVTSQRIDRNQNSIFDPSDILADALARYLEVVQVIAVWGEEQ